MRTWFWSISLIALSALITSRGSLFDQNSNADCSVFNSMMPKCFFPRETTEIRAVFVHYGSAMTPETLHRLRTKLTERFNTTTGGTLSLNIVDASIIPLKQMARDLDKVRASVPHGDESKREPDRLVRLWYYYNLGMGIVNEIYNQMKQAPVSNALKNADVIIATTEAQFDGLGYAAGRLAVMEYPTEIAWKATDGGSTEFSTDDTIIDELLHETAHAIGLDHTSQQCDLPDLSNATREEEATAHEKTTLAVQLRPTQPTY